MKVCTLFTTAWSIVIHFSSKFSARSSASPCSVRIGGVDVAPSNTVRNLGVTFDNSCAMSTHVTNICRSASFALWKIAKIRNVLDEKSAIKLIHAFVTSRLDYCNSLLFGLPLYQIKKINYCKILLPVSSLGLRKEITSPLFFVSYTGSPLISVLNLKSSVSPIR